MGNRLSKCPNKKTTDCLQTRFGELLRVGSLGGYKWTDRITSKACRFVHAYPLPASEFSNTSDCQETVRNLTVCDETSCNPSGSNDSLILVDTFEESVRSQIAAIIECEVLPNSDPKEYFFYIANIAELGFNHIIFIGEVNYGMLFLDCYGRVFVWEDMGGMAYPLGSLEEMPNRPVKDKAWFVEDGIVYELIEEP